jgi:23S rRNA (uridine2552-2'-O)-methyltransferase
MPFRPTPVALSKSASPSSHAWLSRQFRDPYVRQRLSHPAAFRSRSAFKLLEIDERHGKFLSQKDVKAVVDLGAAPGGWTQVVAGKLGWADKPENDAASLKGDGYGLTTRAKLERIGTWSSRREQLDSERIEESDLDIDVNGINPIGRSSIIAVDRLHILPIPGVQTLQADFLSPQTELLIKGLLTSEGNPEGKADIILSDMAANFSGNKIHDTESSLELSKAVFHFTIRNLRTAASIGRSKGGVLLYV